MTRLEESKRQLKATIIVYFQAPGDNRPEDPEATSDLVINDILGVLGEAVARTIGDTIIPGVRKRGKEPKRPPHRLTADEIATLLDRGRAKLDDTVGILKQNAEKGHLTALTRDDAVDVIAAGIDEFVVDVVDRIQGRYGVGISRSVPDLRGGSTGLQSQRRRKP